MTTNSPRSVQPDEGTRRMSLESRKRQAAHVQEMRQALRYINPEYAREIERIEPSIRVEVAERILLEAQAEYEEAVEALRRFDEEWGAGAGVGSNR